MITKDYAVEDIKRMVELLHHIYDIIDDLVIAKYVPYYKWVIPEMMSIIRKQNKTAVSVIDNSKFCFLCGKRIKVENISNTFYCSNCGQRIDLSIQSTPKILYGIKNTTTGEVIFNARGGAYHTYDAALKKLKQLGEDEHMIVTYKLSNNA